MVICWKFRTRERRTLWISGEEAVIRRRVRTVVDMIRPFSKRLAYQMTLNKNEPRRPRKRSDFRAQAVVKHKPLQARRVEIVMDVMGQVNANNLDGEAE